MSAVETMVPEQATAPKMPPGVLFDGPEVRTKLLDSYVALGLMIAGSIAALVWEVTVGMGWIELSVFAFTFAMGSIGIGFMHRYFVHRSFRCGPVMRTICAALATMAVEGPIVKWVSNHRRHHLHSDKPGDVHSPYYDSAGQPHASFAKGIMYAQSGWFRDQATTDPEYYARDILADPIAMFFTRTRWVWYALSAVILPGALGYALGGVNAMIGCVLFAGLFRSLMMNMSTSLVNSVCHSGGRFGYRRFETDDGTTNEPVTMLLTFGEGLHNNHHRFPRDAYLSHAWYEIDINGLIILGLGKLGLVHDVFAPVRPASGAGVVAEQTTLDGVEDLGSSGVR
ncbi:MAG: acyl-CoA desaturase [Bradyrhizobium sp.]